MELALVVLVLYLLLAATTELGRATFGAQALQDVARVAARELALEPLPAGATLADALATPIVQARIYDRRLLVLDLAGDVNQNSIPDGEELDLVFGQMPVVNQLLRPLMIFEVVDGGARLLRYPGALLVDPTAEAHHSGFTVRIPRIVSRDADGVESIDWVDVLEAPTPDPFPIDALGAAQGVAAVRLNYPFQAAAMVGYRESPGGPFEPNVGRPIAAADGAVVEVGSGPGLAFANVSGQVGPYAGQYGLGVQLAHAREVRPFRKLISAQAAFRREVFE